MSKDKRTFDLEERLIDFAVRIIRIAESLPKKLKLVIMFQGRSFVAAPLLPQIMVKHKAQNPDLALSTK